jgi:hypothetical protein
MAKELPSDEKLDSYFRGMDVDINISNEGAPTGTPPYINVTGTIDKIVVDGEGGVQLRISAEVLTEDLPEL